MRATRCHTAGISASVANARLIAPGSAANSIIPNRANRRDGERHCHRSGRIESMRMGSALLTQWINSLTGC
jgi:hypothetical protein